MRFLCSPSFWFVVAVIDCGIAYATGNRIWLVAAGASASVGVIGLLRGKICGRRDGGISRTDTNRALPSLREQGARSKEQSV